MTLQAINPESLGFPKGYSNGMLAPAGGRLLFVAGQVAWNREQQIVGSTFAEQFGQALANIVEVVRQAGGKPEHVARLTIFVIDKQEYLTQTRAVGEAYRKVMGKHFPAMSLIEVRGLIEPGAKMEIEATAVIP